jgi:hypothetical protein
MKSWQKCHTQQKSTFARFAKLFDAALTTTYPRTFPLPEA